MSLSVMKMLSRTVLVTSLSFCATFPLPIPLHADAPGEMYHVSASEISREVIRSIIGMLIINSPFRNTPAYIGTYVKTQSGFESDHTISVHDSTVPLSNFGYQPPLSKFSVEGYKYPILSREGKYFRILYEPRANLQAWINAENLRADFNVSVIMFDSLEVPNDRFVDIFYFTLNGVRELYREPSEGSMTQWITKQSYGPSFKVVEQRGEFLKIGIVLWWELEQEIIPIGWIRLREQNEPLPIWLVDFDNC